MFPEQRLSFITLGVHNLEKAKDFYSRQLGWTVLKDTGGIVFFKLNGFILALFPQQELAEDVGQAPPAQGFSGVTLAYCVRSEKEVDNLFDAFRKKGITILREPEAVYWGGYRGYIADTEGNCWEIAYNPFLELDSQGNVTGHT